MRDAAGLDAAQQLLDGREELAVVGRATDNERVVAEDVAQDNRRIRYREVVDNDLLHPLLDKAAGDAFGRLFRIAVHRGVGHDDPLFSLVAAHAVVEVDHLGDAALPNGSVRRADRRNGQRADLLQGLLHRGAVLADDAGVVATHLVPVAVGVDLRIGNAAVECAERTEGVAREERLLLGAPRDHRLGPVYHRHQLEGERLAAQIERVTLLDLERAVADAVVAGNHLQGLGIADDRYVGIELPQGRDRRRVVGFHVVDDEVVDPAVADLLADVLEQPAAEGLLDRVDQCDLFADDQIGVVGNTLGKRPEALEKVGRAVVDADVADAGKKRCNCHSY